MNHPASPARRMSFVIALLVMTAGFTALGIWQVERREWKHSLIDAVNTRVHADPVAAPGARDWPTLTTENDAYRRIRVTGRFITNRDTLVRAVSDLGSGYWVLTPLDTGHFTVLVNRGFIPPNSRDTVVKPLSGEVTVTGLLRMTEPGGGFLRRNRPDTNDWYSRDVAAIAQARGMTGIAPYFIDADASATAPGAPMGGLTVVRFADNHLVYALTWFAMAGLCLLAAWLVGARRRIPTLTPA